jgi:hypothetical protein
MMRFYVEHEPKQLHIYILSTFFKYHMMHANYLSHLDML